jgi:hypothetical protein
MAGIMERIGALAGTELSKAVDLAHRTFQDRMAVHRHTGRALVETVAEVCRNHPNLVGIGAGLMVEQLLVHEKQKHDAHLAAVAEAQDGAPVPADPFPNATPPDGYADGVLALNAPTASEDAPRKALMNAHLPHSMIKLSHLRPGRVAMEVFGGILLLKLAATGAKMFKHKHQGEVWFAPAAKIHLLSGTITAYNLTAAVRSPKISAWRNGAILFFGTDALKPVLKPTKIRRARR